MIAKLGTSVVIAKVFDFTLYEEERVTNICSTTNFIKRAWNMTTVHPVCQGVEPNDELSSRSEQIYRTRPIRHVRRTLVRLPNLCNAVVRDPAQYQRAHGHACPHQS